MPGTVTGLGGSIDVESSVGAGTIIHVTLPVADGAPQQASPSEKTDSSDAERGKILIIDDDDTTGRFLLRALESDHHVEWVNNAGTGLQRIAIGDYDIAIIDLGIPGMPGDALCMHMKKVDTRLATILGTGWSLEADDPRRQPFDFALNKPFSDVDLLQQTIRDAKSLHDNRVEEN